MSLVLTNENQIGPLSLNLPAHSHQRLGVGSHIGPLFIENHGFHGEYSPLRLKEKMRMAKIERLRTRYESKGWRFESSRARQIPRKKAQLEDTVIETLLR